MSNEMSGFIRAIAMPRVAKFYAVRAGRVPGVYAAWPDAERQVRGFPGAVYKSFPTHADAARWVAADETPSAAPAAPDAAPAGALLVYTDGSHIKGTPRRGIGAYCAHAGREFRLSRDMSHLPADASNPTLEVLAAAAVLPHLARARAHAVVCADYVGVVRYINGDWRPKPAAPGDGAFRAAVRDLCAQLARMRAAGLHVSARHVPGHAGVPGNEKADCLAKLRGDVDEFAEMESHGVYRKQPAKERAGRLGHPDVVGAAARRGRRRGVDVHDAHALRAQPGEVGHERRHGPRHADDEHQRAGAVADQRVGAPARVRDRAREHVIVKEQDGRARRAAARRAARHVAAAHGAHVELRRAVDRGDARGVGAGALVQAVDVGRDDPRVGARQEVVARVRLRGVDGRAEAVRKEKVRDARPLAPRDAEAREHEADGAEAAPQPAGRAGRAERAHARLGRRAGAGERDERAALAQQPQHRVA